MDSENERVLNARARRAAKSVGWYARKSRKRTWSLSDQGGFMLLTFGTNLCVAGQNYDLDANDVLELCKS